MKVKVEQCCIGLSWYLKKLGSEQIGVMNIAGHCFRCILRIHRFPRRSRRLQDLLLKHLAFRILQATFNSEFSLVRVTWRCLTLMNGYCFCLELSFIFLLNYFQKNFISKMWFLLGIFEKFLMIVLRHERCPSLNTAFLQ